MIDKQERQKTGANLQALEMTQLIKNAFINPINNKMPCNKELDEMAN